MLFRINHTAARAFGAFITSKRVRYEEPPQLCCTNKYSARGVVYVSLTMTHSYANLHRVDLSVPVACHCGRVKSLFRPIATCCSVKMASHRTNETDSNVFSNEIKKIKSLYLYVFSTGMGWVFDRICTLKHWQLFSINWCYERFMTLPRHEADRGK